MKREKNKVTKNEQNPAVITPEKTAPSHGTSQVVFPSGQPIPNAEVQKKKSCFSFRNCCCSCFLVIFILFFAFLCVMDAGGIWHVPGIDQLIWRGGPKPEREVLVQGRKVDIGATLQEKFGTDPKVKEKTVEFTEEEASLLINQMFLTGSANGNGTLESAQVTFDPGTAELFIRSNHPETVLSAVLEVVKNGQNIIILPTKVKLGKLPLSNWLARRVAASLESGIDLTSYGIKDIKFEQGKMILTADPTMLQEKMNQKDSTPNPTENSI